MPRQDPMIRTGLLNERRSLRRQLDDNRAQRKAVPQLALELRPRAEQLLDQQRAHLLASLAAIDQALRG